MTNYTELPLEIKLCTPKGKYEVILTIKSDSDTQFSVTEQNAGTVTENEAIAKGESRDVTFNVTTEQNISIEIFCDGDISATAMASYMGE